MSNPIQNHEIRMAKMDIYPVTIIMDRYLGTYSGGIWLAFNLDLDEIPAEVGDDDIIEMDFWGNLPPGLIVGKGQSPDEAFGNLVIEYIKTIK